MLSDKALLIDGISLLYKESYLEGVEKSIDITNKILNKVKLPETLLNEVDERDSLKELKNILLTMRNDTAGQPYQAADILPRMRLVLSNDQDEILYESLKETLKPATDSESARISYYHLQNQIKSRFNIEELEKLSKEFYHTLTFKPENIDSVHKYVQEHISSLEAFANSENISQEGVIARVSLDDLSKLEELYEQVNTEASGESIMKCPYQDVNRFLEGGFRRGLFYLLSALSHKGKSYFCMCCLIGIAMFQKPYLFNSDKIPTLVLISAENLMDDNLSKMYKTVYEWLNPSSYVGLEELANIPASEKAQFVSYHMSRMGWHVEIINVNPSEWTFRNYYNTIQELENAGHEIAFVLFDYLNMISKEGCTYLGTTGSDIKNLFQRIRNFNAPRKIAFLTPHQMSTDVLNLVRDERDDLVKLVNGGGYYADSRKIWEEVDCEIYLHKVDVNGISYATIQRGKHRISIITPSHQTYVCLPYNRIGGLLPDLDRESSAVTKPGAIKVFTNNTVTEGFF